MIAFGWWSLRGWVGSEGGAGEGVGVVGEEACVMRKKRRDSSEES